MHKLIRHVPGFAALALAIGLLITAPASAGTSHGNRSIGQGPYHIGTVRGTITYLGFDSSNPGQYVRSVNAANERNWYFETTGTCSAPGLTFCNEGHWRNNGNLRLVAADCFARHPTIESDTDQIGDTWFDTTDTSANSRVVSRHCSNGDPTAQVDAIASNETIGDRWSLSDCCGYYNAIAFYVNGVMVAGHKGTLVEPSSAIR